MKMENYLNAVKSREMIFNKKEKKKEIYKAMQASKCRRYAYL